MKLFLSLALVFNLLVFWVHSDFTFAMDSIPEKEMTLKTLYESLDSDLDLPTRKFKIDTILKIWRDVLDYPESFWYPFDSLSYVGKVYATDSTLRVFSWNIPKADGTHDYFSFVQLINRDNKEVKYFELNQDYSASLNKEDQFVGTERWYGCLYYEVIPVTVRNRKYYTLLGLDLNNLLTNRKLIDVLYFENDVLKLGAPIFQIGRKMQSRVIFEYSSRAVMSLRYDHQRKMIVHDHLSPFQPRYEGQYQFYGPDFSFDGFIFENGRWKQVLDIDLSN